MCTCLTQRGTPAHEQPTECGRRARSRSTARVLPRRRQSLPACRPLPPRAHSCTWRVVITHERTFSAAWSGRSLPCLPCQETCTPADKRCGAVRLRTARSPRRCRHYPRSAGLHHEAHTARAARRRKGAGTPGNRLQVFFHSFKASFITFLVIDDQPRLTHGEPAGQPLPARHTRAVTGLLTVRLNLLHNQMPERPTERRRSRWARPATATHSSRCCLGAVLAAAWLLLWCAAMPRAWPPARHHPHPTCRRARLRPLIAKPRPTVPHAPARQHGRAPGSSWRPQLLRDKRHPPAGAHR